MKIIIGILMLGLIVFIHELGHCLVAKASGIIVEEFSIGMGPKLIKFRKGTTEYSLRLFPIGGLCAMKGEDTDEYDEGSFNSAHVVKRILTVAAGPLFNFAFAIILSIIVISAAGIDVPYVYMDDTSSPAYEAGLRDGDIITKFNGASVANSRELYLITSMDELPTDKITVQFTRDGKRMTISYAPETVVRYMLGYYYTESNEVAEIDNVIAGLPFDNARIKAGDVIAAVNGTAINTMSDLVQYWIDNPMTDEELEVIYMRNGRAHTVFVTPQVHTTAYEGFSYNFARENTGIAGTLTGSFGETGFWIRTTLRTLKMLFTGKAGVDDLSGPVGIVSAVGDAYDEASASGGALEVFVTLMNLMILITANLGVINLLPFPALDGGRLVFLIIEAIRRKPINKKVEAIVNTVGMILIFALAAFLIFNDVFKLFF